jgi:hypothetical protein
MVIVPSVVPVTRFPETFSTLDYASEVEEARGDATPLGEEAAGRLEANL